MKKLLAVMILSVFLVACDSSTHLIEDQPQIQFDKAAFIRELAAWKTQGITDYTFVQFYSWVVTEGLGCITVKDEKITDVDNKNPSLEEHWKTIPGIFDWINNYYEYALSQIKEIEKGQYFFIDVEYDTQYHFPKKATTGFGSYTSDLEGLFPVYFVMEFQPIK
jgi:hypothetical protein